jgi:hypothetical protein
LNGRPLPFARAVDLFCQSNSPWLLWMVAVAALRAVESPLQAVSTPVAVWYIAGATLVAVAARAAQLDLRLFRDVLAPARPVHALAVQRLVAWSCALGYFLGIAIWPNVVGFVRG